MSPYLRQLHADLEAVVLARWQECPPHFYEMGVPDPWLLPPAGYDGPPAGFGRGDTDEDDDNIAEEDDWPFDDPTAEVEAAPTSADVLENLKFDQIIEEVEHYVQDRPRITMFDHFDLLPAAFPPAERLTDEQLEALVHTIRRLWAAFNFTAVIPEQVPARIVYPILLERMAEPAMIMKFGQIGIEFCDYEPKECPWGLDYCTCKDF